MIRKQLMAVSLVACAFGTALANEYRAPLVSERGPLRYDLTMKQDKWSIETWSIAHSRLADRGFLSDEGHSRTLPSVIFGKETFNIGESFQQDSVVLSTGYFQNQNPYFFLTQFTPIAEYTDEGMTIGARFEYPVFENKGRIGLRYAVPFKTVSLVRDDEEDCPFSGINTYVIHGDQARDVDATGAPKAFYGINRYKLSLLMQLRTIVAGGQVRPSVLLNPGTPAVVNPSGFYGTQYNLPPASGTVATPSTPSNNAIQFDNTPGDKQGYGQGNDIPFVLIQGTGASNQFPPQFTVPCAVTIDETTGAFTGDVTTSRVAFGFNLTVPTANNTDPTGSQLIALNADLSNLDAANQGRGFAFVQDRDYTNIVNEPGFNTLWVTPVFDGNTTQMTQVASAAVQNIEQQLQAYQQSALCALAQQGFLFETYRSTGIGDLDFDLFYEHTFNEHWRAELWLGVRFPTGGSNVFCGNPYRIEIGNGGHFEIKIGGNLGWQTPWNWLALKADLSYAFVLESTEQRAAAFQGATVNNIGPCTPAEVDWGYLTGHVDFNFYHPKSRKLCTVIGYEIYYKTEDNVCFKNKTVTDSFLGQVWADTLTNQGVLSPAGPTVAGNAFVPYPMTLDNKVAERQTERIAHRIRSEINWHAHKYWSLFAGGAATFAGQNIFRESEIHGGINVRY